VMPGHVIYPKVDAKPAGFSRIWVEEILRKRLRFTGTIFSDDLSMEAARQGGTLTEGARAALEAGCDMVLICNQPHEAEKVLDALRGFEPRRAAKVSGQRIRRMLGRGKALRWDKLVADPAYIEAQALLRSVLP
jgi:beta-N-acetylhexosaminidase